VSRDASDEEIINAYEKVREKYIFLYTENDNPNKPDDEKKQKGEKILAALAVAYENLIDPVKRTQHDKWIDEQDKNAISDISKSVEKKISNFSDEIKHIGENAENKIHEISDGLKKIAKNTGEKIDLDSMGENAQKKINEFNKDFQEFTKNKTEKIDVDQLKKSFNQKFYPFFKVSVYITISVIILVVGLSITDRYIKPIKDMLNSKADIEEADKPEQKDAAENSKKEELATNYPYTAYLTCEFMGNHTNIIPCFLGDHVNTQLEITNGGDYQMLQGYELNKVGKEYSEGLVIQLHKSFAIRAQNANSDFILTLKIEDSATGRQIYKRSASQWKTLAVENK
jgi:hypothetical protein